MNRLGLPAGILTYGILWSTAFIMLAPLFWSVMTALKPNAEVFQAPYLINPDTLSLRSFADVFRQAPFFLYFLNTLKITLACTLGVAATSALAGYAFARLQFPGRDILFMIYLTTMMIPRQVTLVPMFMLMKQFGLIDNHLSLILPGIFSAFGTFLLRQFFLTVPADYDEAAKIDGCGVFRRFTLIMLPFAKATLATLVLLTFMAVWNDFLYPMVFLNSETERTLTMGLAIFRGDADVQWNILMAAVVISNIPILIAFLATQRFVINGVSMSGGIKG
ncbi:MAG: sugar ABC transporter permease [Treponema sp. GWB1_62_6]|nr:MAG: sugar ABC transporter permease [Treponema sp. GWA1_62_8]OHE64827.1 MAG: sugar ABC transporter permease [Treponema sp. GWC1_61_84]OHE67759.1 MAG: sugar ABC transporter permease [Treponema sp. GWB1_62_6]OHE75653.1 MAG: sugar ABC transporter permease [Treponema sp. RIFOXYC1_FULL_61_9]HCM27536.1 sugar ABC transporter permease [Treponema sp.]